jgi:uncharacterized protein (DUF1778 family)
VREKEKTTTIGARTTEAERLAVRAYAALQGRTVSQLIEEAVIRKAVAPLKAAAAEVEVSDEVVD